jgi:hypothetical protein
MDWSVDLRGRAVFCSVRASRTVRVDLADGPRHACSSRVLRVLAQLRLRSAVFSSIGWAKFRTVRMCRADSPWVPGGQSVGAWRTFCVLPADGLLFAVRLWRFCCLFRTVRGSGRTVRSKGADSLRYPVGQSARPLRTVRPAWPDSPPEPGSFVPWFDSSLVSFVLPRVLQGIVPKT